jgi:hypothetical protein
MATRFLPRNKCRKFGENAVHYASNRLSVNLAGIAALLDGFRPEKKETVEPAIDKLLNQIGSEQIFQGNIPCGKEVLL